MLTQPGGEQQIARQRDAYRWCLGSRHALKEVSHDGHSDRDLSILIVLALVAAALVVNASRATAVSNCRTGSGRNMTAPSNKNDPQGGQGALCQCAGVRRDAVEIRDLSRQ